MLKGRHLLSPQDLSPGELEALLDKAAELKQKLKRGEPHEYLRGRTLGMIFAKPSTRTRVSFETAMTQLGGHAIYLGLGELQLGRGETIADTARTLSRYVDAVVARLFEHGQILELASNSSVPVVNGLTNLLHPCQTLADILTIREHKDGLRGLKLAWIGDGNNVCNSLLLGGTLVGMDLAIACPRGYEPDAKILEQAKRNAALSGSGLELTRDQRKAASNADIIYTDVWVSMGQERERKRRLRAFKRYQVNEQLMKLAKRDAIFMHCLPAHRGEEVTDGVIDGPSSVVFDQAENRLHTEKAVLCAVML